MALEDLSGRVARRWVPQTRLAFHHDVQADRVGQCGGASLRSSAAVSCAHGDAVCTTAAESHSPSIPGPCGLGVTASGGLALGSLVRRRPPTPTGGPALLRDMQSETSSEVIAYI